VGLSDHLAAHLWDAELLTCECISYIPWLALAPDKTIVWHERVSVIKIRYYAVLQDAAQCTALCSPTAGWFQSLGRARTSGRADWGV
jgi:hypothetical protein